VTFRRSHFSQTTSTSNIILQVAKRVWVAFCVGNGTFRKNHKNLPFLASSDSTRNPSIKFINNRADTSLLEGVTSRKGNDLEWINISDDEFVVREKEDNCSEGSNGAEEKKNDEPENPENNDECHML
jgi:hypothetical protein